MLVLVGAAVVWGAGRIAASSTASAASAPERSSSVRATASTRLLARATPARAAATWCGTPSQIDTTPNAIAGNAVHWIYAIPSDGEDRFATFASVMQTDAETIDAWWRSQDPTRAPRGDVAPFACGLQLDLSLVRLPQSSAQLSATESPFSQIWDALLTRGFRSGHMKYLVYYDGAVGNSRICGAGGTAPQSIGMAMVYLRSCPGITSAEVAAHELVHAMGAVPTGAPHMCPPPNGGHTCDSAVDLMYPYTDGTPLSAVALDPGRDDYYGHAGSWPDVQDSPWLVFLDRQAQFQLTISGPGRVVSDVPGLDCTQTCTTTWNAGTRLGLTPIPARGARLVRWSGACAGASQCFATAGEGASGATAVFAAATYRVSVRVSGRGSVRSSTPGIACPGRCASQFSSYTPLRLSATPRRGWKLKGWSGACRGTRSTCTLPMSANASARAIFVRR
jgi:Divergent InlB B-repeat domain